MSPTVSLPISFLAGLLLMCFASFSQNKISGIVRDDNGDVLEKATLHIKGLNNTTVTDINGAYTLAANKPFPWTVILSYSGRASQEFTVIREGQFDFTLTEPGSLQNVTIVGTRGKPRTDVNRPVPVDILTSRELQNTGQIELGQQLQFASPSYNSAKYGINGSLVYADYATLRGLGPDQLLVLVNGKRRHQFSIPHIGFSISRGMVVTDMNTIPSLAIERSEILRDGAASQYGSDAIAGIVNLRLREAVNQGTAKTQIGTTKEGDGTNFLAAINYGFKLGKEKSFLNFTLHYQKLGETNRSDPYTGTIYSTTKRIDDSIRAVRGFYPATAPFKIGVFGQSEVKSPQFFINAGYPINDKWALYGFGGYSYKKAIGYGFFRNAIPTNANSDSALFPNGYVPVFPAEDKDYSAVLGVTRTVLNGWNMDFSTGYGKNAVDRFARHTANASMGAASPTEFYVGYSSFGQSTTEANLSKYLKGLWRMKAVNIAFGSQFRVDKYVLKRGEEAAYKIGPLAATQNKTPGVQGIAGTAPEDEANKTRTNLGIYADLEADITERLLIATALRFENYSDFGSNFSGKLATRLNITKNVALRGSINRGFRAPSLQQIFNSATTTTVQAGAIRYTKQFASNATLLDSIGIEKPKPEISWNYNLGLAIKGGQKFLFTVDAYQIDIRDKIVVSEALTVANIAALKNRLQGTGIQIVSFFTNQVNTQTRGIDFITTYKTNVGSTGRLDASLGMTFNKTKITEIKKTPDQLQEGTTARIALIDTINIALIETAQPRQKLIFSLNYAIGKFNFIARSTYFGPVTAWEKPSGLPHIKQDFGGKTLLDASIGFNIARQLLLTVGSNNITNQYPDKVLPTLTAYNAGQSPYNRNVNQFGFSGAYYYSSLTLRF
ncbi:MAG: TonB-dependent receptor [Bacteroidota bacterium]|nr:TonB-dependent receptor [Bacteroidota bacterium]